MRIVSGQAGGIRLRVPKGSSVRPTEDRVKESVFASLGDITGACVLDLFAGTGALGLEALSRGAQSVVFVERDRRVIPVLNENIAAVQKSMAGDAGRTRVICGAVERCWGAVEAAETGFNLIFADPPYHVEEGQLGAGELLRCPEFARVGREALLLLEHAADVSLPWFPRSSWRIGRQKRYGNTLVSMARQRH